MASRQRPQTSRSKTSAIGGRVATKKSSGTVVAPPAEKKFELPPLSIGSRKKHTATELEKLKKKTIRRNAPPGEDLKQIKQLLLTMKRQKTPMTVQEFISLMAPSTGDRGETLRQVMQEHLNSFRQLSRKVYDTILQDVSDVLLNQQLQLSEFYKEKKQLLQDKMMRRIEEIYQMAPTFDFERYSQDGENYLQEVLPIPPEIHVEPEELETMKRQAAYHRLAWLKSEGERLNEENSSLKQRLDQLKRMHQQERAKMMQLEQEAQAKRDTLEAAQAEKTEALEELNESLEKHIIDKERMFRENDDQDLLLPVVKTSKTKANGAKKKRSKGRPAWNETTARELEQVALETQKVKEAANVLQLPVEIPKCRGRYGQPSRGT